MASPNCTPDFLILGSGYHSLPVDHQKQQQYWQAEKLSDKRLAAISTSGRSKVAQPLLAPIFGRIYTAAVQLSLCAIQPVGSLLTRRWPNRTSAKQPASPAVRKPTNVDGVGTLWLVLAL